MMTRDEFEAELSFLKIDVGCYRMVLRGVVLGQVYKVLGGWEGEDGNTHLLRRDAAWASFKSRGYAQKY